MTRRVAYVLKSFPRLSETFILNEILAVRAQGVAVDVFALERSAETTLHPDAAALLPEVTFLAPPTGRCAPLPMDVPEKHRDAARIGAALAGPLRRRGITHVHAHFAGVAATTAAFAARGAGVPFSFTAHAKDIFVDKVDWTWLRTLGRAAHAVVTVSDWNARFLRDRLPLARIVRIWNGVDLERWQPVGSRRATVTPLVVGVGRFVRKKGFHVLVEALAELRDRGVQVRAILAGGGREREALEQRARELKLRPARLRFAGSLTQPEVRRLLRRADIVALPCVVDHDGNQDALPTVLLEASATGVPCVSTDIAGVPEIIANGRSGYVVEPGDARVFADALARLAASATRRRAFGRAARRLAEERFDQRQVVGALIGLFAAARDSLDIREVALENRAALS